ncbi:helix-turn-helix domain-containing protein [Saccharothrix algeriensis]|uniref:AraC-like DNA-binding protein n=1 Tax=Saccharothrix algeriensis TaxID=173560 RepID=A0A8T8I3Q9_9PSEU|nr:AraC family transcriptional regulator [Saccharothrix algeriensis]MBM7811100.1 AraC-like DNA-binding protein [Saccharothrix algeriensis]QTR05040.1 helix-turn-helix transcriptional regulator [Saccharothrix algeriensis]
MSYVERPAAGLDCAWRRSSATPAVGRVVPDGCTDIIWSSDRALVVAGPDTVGHVTAMGPGEVFGVRFGPGVGPAALGVPAHALRDQRVPLSELWGGSAALEDALAAADDPCAVLAAAARERLRATPPDPVAARIARSVRTSSVAALADDLGLSTRQVHRRSLDAFGYGPKVLHRVLRFDRAVKLAWRGVPFADVAHRTGYTDQAHLAREVKDLAGVPLGQLIRS